MCIRDRGHTEYLLERINEKGFRNTLLFFIKQGGVYVGVSAGSLAAAGNLKGSMGILECPVRVHCEKGMKVGPAAVSYTHLHAISYVQSHPAGDRGNPKAVRAGIYRPDHNISCFRFCDG